LTVSFDGDLNILAECNQEDCIRTRRIFSFMKTTRRGGRSVFYCGQRAEIVGLDSEDRIELAAKVLERNHRSQFY